MKISIDTFHYTGSPVKWVSVDGDEPWFKRDHVARILGYANIAKALIDVDDTYETKTLGELLSSSNPDIFISFYGLNLIVRECNQEYAVDFRKWVWSNIITLIRRTNDHCSYDDDDDDDVASNWSEDATQGKDEEEPWHDFSTNRNPKYWLGKFNKTALMKECDKRGVIIDNPMMTLNVKIIQALIAADTI